MLLLMWMFIYCKKKLYSKYLITYGCMLMQLTLNVVFNDRMVRSSFFRYKPPSTNIITYSPFRLCTR